MKRAWLVVNAFLQAASFRKMEEMLLDAARRAGIGMDLKTNDAFISAQSLNARPDAVLFFDKDIRLAQRMEAAGIRLFNRSDAIAVCDDKTATTLRLSSAGLPQPDTILCPMTFPGIGFTRLDFLDRVGEQLGYPMIVKEGMGSFGNQVYLASDKEEAISIITPLAHRPLLFQRYVSESSGQDLRVYVVGGRVVAAIRRVNLRGDFRANIEHGGTAFPYSPDAEEASLAVAACTACGTDFAGVDLLLSSRGPLVCEVNSNAHFIGLAAATGRNPADDIMRLVRDSI